MKPTAAEPCKMKRTTISVNDNNVQLAHVAQMYQAQRQFIRHYRYESPNPFVMDN